MMQIDIERGQEFRKCIECFMCQDVCHVIRDHEENKARYAGPRLFIRFMELESHPLDTDDRRELLRQRMGLGMCNITKCCTEVCPEHIKITDNAIIPLKERVVDASYDPVAWLGRKILRRTKRSASRRDVAADVPPASTVRWRPAPTTGATPEATVPQPGVGRRLQRGRGGRRARDPGPGAGLAVRDGRFSMAPGRHRWPRRRRADHPPVDDRAGRHDQRRGRGRRGDRSA